MTALYDPITHRVVAGAASVRLSPGQGAILHTLIEADDDGLTRVQIHKRVFRDKTDGVPKIKIVDVQLYHLRNRLARLDVGIGIETLRESGSPARYVLAVPLEIGTGAEGAHA